LAKDSQVCSYLFTSLSEDTFSQVADATTAAELWAAIQTLQASQSRARIMSTRMALATATKGSSTVAEFFTKMKGLADEMASAGKKLDDDEVVSYILMVLERSSSRLHLRLQTVPTRFLSQSSRLSS
jgi:hypothetical protein